ncbi:MAG: hypothetical protein KAQ98_05290 [Bacteriovoracaceae bacterium]|nr:hypothetical protein [Bacteriovoracaceae bacterium]
MQKCNVIIITGDTSPEKTSFFEEFTNRLKKNWKIGGVSGHYQKRPDIFVLDNHELIPTILKNNIPNLILSITKSQLENFRKKYSMDHVMILDFDKMNSNLIEKKILSSLKKGDGEKIGLYASMTSLVEVGLGSTLRGFHVPFKGTFLAGLQNFMLILFGKDLKGRGLFWIVLITAGLKSFSLTGSKLRPMLYIFVQGTLLVAPSWIFGWNFFSVLLGSVLMGLSTVIMSLAIKYILFGTVFIEAYMNAFHKLFSWVGFSGLGFWHIVLLALVVKSLIGIIIACAGYFFQYSGFLEKLEFRINKLNPEIKTNISILHRSSWKSSLLEGGRDILSKRYFIPFIFISLVIYFFTRMAPGDYMLIIVRGLSISWFGFVLARRIDFHSIIKHLEKRELSYVADGMLKALNVVEHIKKKR